MRYIIIVLCILSIIVLSTYKVDGEVIIEKPVETPIVDTESMTINEIVDYIAPQYNQNAWLIYNICKAESDFDSNADHDSGKGKGICGIHKSTFEYWEKKFGIDLNYNSDFDQIKMTTIAFSNGSLYRNQWSTYVRYKNYGVFTKAEELKILAIAKKK